MISLPGVAEPLLMSFSIAFTEPTFQRSLVLLVGAILAKGRRTITNLLWTVGYDTYYAMTDRDDDLKIGVKSTAILFGDADRVIIGILQVMVLVCLVMIGFQAKLGMTTVRVVILNLGLAVAVAEMCVAGQLGARVSVDAVLRQAGSSAARDGPILLQGHY